jgi:hypothetical protein
VFAAVIAAAIAAEPHGTRTIRADACAGEAVTGTAPASTATAAPPVTLANEPISAPAGRR